MKINFKVSARVRGRRGVQGEVPTRISNDYSILVSLASLLNQCVATEGVREIFVVGNTVIMTMCTHCVVCCHLQ